MNVDEVEEVIPMCQELNILFPLEGVVKGHYKKDNFKTKHILDQLTRFHLLQLDCKEFF